MENSGMLIIISGPSGSGKGTVVKNLDEKKGYALSISVTTRKMREGEVDGRDYFFHTQEEYFEMLEAGELLEHATFCGNCYGTPRTYVEEQIEKGKMVILEIEVNGALQVKEKFPECVLIFLLPPTKDELERRLVGRATEDSEVIEFRLKRAEEEIKLIHEYDYLVINDDIDEAVRNIERIAIVEGMKPCRSLKKISKFKGDN